jgi:hypothetical protein
MYLYFTGIVVAHRMVVGSSRREVAGTNLACRVLHSRRRQLNSLLAWSR